MVGQFLFYALVYLEPSGQSCRDSRLFYCGDYLRSAFCCEALLGDVAQLPRYTPVATGPPSWLTNPIEGRRYAVCLCDARRLNY